MMALTPQTIREYDRTAPAETDTATATFGLGCFWGPEAAFAARSGVVRTAVGYAGGTSPDPTYHDLGDHTEVVRLTFEPTTISYRGLLDHALEAYSHRSQPAKRQYHRIVLAETDRQADAVETAVAEMTAGAGPDAIATRLERLDTFYLAESYHQKHGLRGKRWVTNVFDEAGYGDDAFRRSPAAAKLHAHVTGHDVDVPFLNARSRDVR